MRRARRAGKRTAGSARCRIRAHASRPPCTGAGMQLACLPSCSSGACGCMVMLRTCNTHVASVRAMEHAARIRTGVGEAPSNGSCRFARAWIVVMPLRIPACPYPCTLVHADRVAMLLLLSVRPSLAEPQEHPRAPGAHEVQPQHAAPHLAQGGQVNRLPMLDREVVASSWPAVRSSLLAFQPPANEPGAKPRTAENCSSPVGDLWSVVPAVCGDCGDTGSPVCSC